MKMDRAGNIWTHPLPPSLLSASPLQWWQWWETPSGGEMYQCGSSPLCHIHRTESIIYLTVVKAVNMTGTQTRLSSLRRGKMKGFTDLNDENLNYGPEHSNLHTPALYSLIRLRDQCRNYCSWKPVMSVWRKEEKKTPEIWQNVFCMEPATVATVTVWLMAVWFGFRAVPCFACNLCVYVYKHLWQYTCLHECKCLHCIGLYLCVGGVRTERQNFLCTVESNCPPLSCLLGHS